MNPAAKSRAFWFSLTLTTRSIFPMMSSVTTAVLERDQRVREEYDILVEAMSRCEEVDTARVIELATQLGRSVRPDDAHGRSQVDRDVQATRQRRVAAIAHERAKLLQAPAASAEEEYRAAVDA